MKVSRMSALLFLSIIFAMCLILSPVVAGEHPWDENKKGGTTSSDTTTYVPTIDTNQQTDPGSGNGISGTTAFWWQFLFHDIFDGKSGSSAPATKVGNKNGDNLNKVAGQ